MGRLQSPLLWDRRFHVMSFEIGNAILDALQDIPIMLCWLGFTSCPIAPTRPDPGGFPPIILVVCGLFLPSHKLSSRLKLSGLQVLVENKTPG
jgi:hypothetical protein